MELAAAVYGGESTGTPVVVLHGLFGSSRNWQALAKRLARHAPIHCLDLRNHGDSPQSEAMDLPAMAADVAAYVERLGGGAVSLLGHSLGGKVAMTLALTEPWQIEHLLVLDIAPVSYARNFHPYLEAMRAVPLHLLTQRSDADLAMETEVPDPKIRSFLLRNLVETEDGWAWRCHLDAIARALPDLLSFPAFPNDIQFAGPTLFLRGALSDYVTPDHAEAIERLFPNAVHDVVAGAGHWVHADKPEAFLSRAIDFLFAA